MSLNEEERKIIVGLEYEKAQAIMAQIEGLKSLGYWDNIANRLYYALFHAVSALLIRDKHAVNTHRGVVVLFGQHYVRTGIFDMAMVNCIPNCKPCARRATTIVSIRLLRRRFCQ